MGQGRADDVAIAPLGHCALTRPRTSKRGRPGASGSRKNSQVTTKPSPAAGTTRMRSRAGSIAATMNDLVSPGSYGMISPLKHARARDQCQEEHAKYLRSAVSRLRQIPPSLKAQGPCRNRILFWWEIPWKSREHRRKPRPAAPFEPSPPYLHVDRLLAFTSVPWSCGQSHRNPSP
jgi:hypothetical protein